MAEGRAAARRQKADGGKRHSLRTNANSLPATRRCPQHEHPLAYRSAAVFPTDPPSGLGFRDRHAGDESLGVMREADA